MSTKLQYKGYS